MAPLAAMNSRMRPQPRALASGTSIRCANTTAHAARRRVSCRSNTPQSGETELWQLHEELLKEIEQRKRQQTELLQKFKQIDSAAPMSAPVSAPSTLRPPIAPMYSPPVYSPSRPTPQAPQPTFRPQQPSPHQKQPQQPAVVDVTPPSPPIPVNENAMKIVFVGAECAPWSKTGGLGDVMGALPKALAHRGHRVMVIAPRYDNYDDAWETGVRKTYSVMGWPTEVGYFHAFRDNVDYVFVDHPCYHNMGREIYGGERGDIQFRCALLCKAALEAVWHVPCGGVPYGDDNCIFVANDWHTALLPTYLQAHYRDHGQMTYTRSIFVIHNIAHQGRGPFDEANKLELNEEYKEQLRLFDPMGGEHMNIMKGGLQNAHRVVAVSHGYAWECQTQEGGWGLDKVLQENNWKLRGIVNGIDYNEWSPMYDPFLKKDGYTNYDLQGLERGKAQCKAALQRELGLPVDPSIPMFGFIGRLDYQKGVDLIRDVYDWMMGERVQLVLLGSGRADLEDSLRDMEARRPDQCKAWVGFSVAMAHRITAGVDLLLMPSRFEPCGLNQLYAMSYGTIPIVHAVGGLRDTVTPFNPYENSGTGWVFDRAEGGKLREAVGNALTTYHSHRDSFAALQRRGMEQDLSWDKAAQQYEEVLTAAKFQW